MTKHSAVIGEASVPLAMQDENELPVIWVNNFDEDTAKEFFYDFSCYLSDDKIEKIVVYVDSNGGDLDALFSMAEIIECSTKPVVTVNAGKSLSAGAILFSLGEERWMAPASRLMFHNVQVTAISMDSEDMKRYLNTVSRMNEEWIKRVIKKSNLTQKQFNNLLKDSNGELYLNAKEAIKYGFADHIGFPLIKETRQWVLEV